MIGWSRQCSDGPTPMTRRFVGGARNQYPMGSREHGCFITGRHYNVKRGKALVEMDGWALIDAKDVDDQKRELTNTKYFVSYMWHDCDALRFEYRDEEDAETECEIRYLDGEDSQMGKCWYCMASAPVNIKTLWTIHNMSIIHHLDDPLKESWEEKYLQGRLEDIEESKKNAREAGWYDG